MPFSEKKILLVDNDPDLTELIHAAFETLGRFRVRTENDPARAAAAAREFAPDLIVMDICMPDLDGADVAIRLQADPILSETPIVFLTGAVSVPKIGTHKQGRGGLRFLPKTMPLESMIAVLREILRGPESASATSRAA